MFPTLSPSARTRLPFTGYNAHTSSRVEYSWPSATGGGSVTPSGRDAAHADALRRAESEVKDMEQQIACLENISLQTKRNGDIRGAISNLRGCFPTDVKYYGDFGAMQLKLLHTPLLSACLAPFLLSMTRTSIS